MSKQPADAGEALERRAGDPLLLRAGRQGGLWLIVMAVTALTLAVGETLLPAVLGRTVDAVIGRHASTRWLIWFGLLVALLVVFDAMDDMATGAATARSTRWLRYRLLGHVLSVGPAITDIFAPGDLATRVVGNAADAGHVGPDVIRAVSSLVPAIGGTVALALINPWLCLTFLTGLPVAIVLLRLFARDASDLAARYVHVQGQIAGRLIDALSGGRTIAAAGTADREAARILAPLPDLHEAGMGMWRAQTRVTTQDSLLVPLLEVAVLAVAGALLSQGRISPGEMLAAGQYVVLGATFGSAVGSVTKLARARAGARRAVDVFDQAAVSYGNAPLPDGAGRIDFREVTVRAGDRVILDRVELSVPPRRLVAVVGRSGSGKSVLAALVGRLIDPDEGQVLLDGVELSTLGRAELRRSVAYGFERPSLLGETLFDAVTLGAPNLAPDEVSAACRAARADEFIRRMPAGYQTRLVDAPMSGGERQRVGIARAFAQASRVIVLDDVAASLDTVTEHHISEVLTDAFADRTRLVVAHRASTAARADMVVWLDERRIRAIGRHHALWEIADYRALFAPDDVDDNLSQLDPELEPLT